MAQNLLEGKSCAEIPHSGLARLVGGEKINGMFLTGLKTPRYIWV